MPTPEDLLTTVGSFSKRYHVIALDIPGFNLSHKLISNRATLSRLSQWLLTFLDEQKISSAHFVSHSFSAGISAHLALNSSDRVASLCWLSLPQWFQSKSGVEPAIFKLVSTLDNTVSDQRHVVWLEAMFHKKPKVSKLMELYHKRMFSRYRNEIDNVLADLKFSFKQLPIRLNQIESPIMAIYGEESSFEIDEVKTKLEEWLPQIQMHVLPKCGHVISLEKPKEFAARYENFLKSL